MTGTLPPIAAAAHRRAIKRRNRGANGFQAVPGDRASWRRGRAGSPAMTNVDTGFAALAYHIAFSKTGTAMPVLSMFYGIVVYMYAFDNRRHHRPHFHAEFAEFSAVVAIDDGDVLDGELPKAKMKLVQAWLEIHREDLMADWKLSIQGLPPQRIKPLD